MRGGTDRSVGPVYASSGSGMGEVACLRLPVAFATQTGADTHLVQSFGTVQRDKRGNGLRPTSRITSESAKESKVFGFRHVAKTEFSDAGKER